MRIGSFDDCPPGLPQALARAASLSPQRGITLLDNRGREASFRGFAEIEEFAKLGAAKWRTLGIQAGDRVMVCLPTSWDFIDAWLGAVLQGALPVAIAPPGALGSPAAQVGKALRVCQSVGAACLLAPSTLLKEAHRGMASGTFERVSTQLLDVEIWQKLEASPQASGLAFDPLDPPSEATAFLQLTSGSTGVPRAVEITHRGVIHNAQVIRESIAAPHGERTEHIVSWLPLYHDMGLIGCLSNCIVNQTPMDLLSPRSFLARPWVWLEAIQRRQRVMAPAPNFAYQMCVERVSSKRVESLDLSSYHHILSGSEMVRPETVAAFLEHFKEAKVEPHRFRPCYGLAEATLAVTVDISGAGVRTQSPPTAAGDGQPGDGARPHAAHSDGPHADDTHADDAPTVALGQALTDHDLAILPMDVEGESARSFDLSRALGEDRVGRVLMRSPAVMKGYYGDSAATREVLRDGWLDTGDLGFLHQGELYLTGRSKEVLILNGTNVMPHEIEWVAESASEAGGSERCGAFSVLGDHGEEPILVLETKCTDPDDLRQVQREVATAIGSTLSIALTDLALVKRGSIPRTSSGKVQRRALQQMYSAGQIERLDEGSLPLG